MQFNVAVSELAEAQYDKILSDIADELKNHLDILENNKKYELTLQDMTNMLREEADIDLQFLDDGNKIDRK